MGLIVSISIDDDKTATSRPHILLIESEPALREVLQQLFDAEGWRATAAADGATGLAHFKATPPDCVVCAVRLRDGNGLEVIKQFKNLNQRIPVVIVSILFEDGIEERSYEAGADAFFLKPFEIETFLKTITQLINGTPPPHPSA